MINASISNEIFLFYLFIVLIPIVAIACIDTIPKSNSALNCKHVIHILKYDVDNRSQVKSSSVLR